MTITPIQQLKRKAKETGKPCHNVALLYKLRMGFENTRKSTIVIKIPMYLILSKRRAFLINKPPGAAGPRRIYSFFNSGISVPKLHLRLKGYGYSQRGLEHLVVFQV